MEKNADNIIMWCEDNNNRMMYNINILANELDKYYARLKDNNKVIIFSALTSLCLVGCVYILNKRLTKLESEVKKNGK